MKNHSWTTASLVVVAMATTLPSLPVSAAPDKPGDGPGVVRVIKEKPADATSLQRLGKAVLASKPLTYWRMHGKEEAVAVDTSPNGNNGTYEEGASPYSPDGKAGNLNGGRMRAELELPADTYSVELWFWNETPHHARLVTGYIFSRGPDADKSATGDHLGIGGTHAAAGRLFLFNGNQLNQTIEGSTQLVPRTWNHVVMVRQKSEVAVYLNGHSEPEIQGRLAATYKPDSAQVFVGGRSDNFANLVGRMDEVALYDRALTPKEAKAHFDAAGVTLVEGPKQEAAVRVAKDGETEHFWYRFAADDSHWAYRKPTRPPLPSVKDLEWCKQPIDLFVLQKLEEADLQPSPAATPSTWFRRVHFDLTGLPPKIEEIEDFLDKDSPRFRSKVVDRLLDSPHFGERWARHWLDLARYGDSTGIHEDAVRPSWAWRDWVVQAFNDDMPFDQFTIEQLAGDLLPNATLVQRVATGFHRAAPFNTEAGTPKEARRTYQVLDRVNVTGTVWLGATLECAQCHDHFYDPISQKEYYQLVAFFNNTPDEMGKSIGAGRAAMTGPTVKVGDASTFVMQEMQKKRTSQIFLRGNYETKGEKVLPKVPGFLHPPDQEAPDNRLGLAQWLVDPENPLTPRVTVNRWWTEIFGTGLVRTGADFGTQGEAPSHPDLLDWLAVEFVEQNWSMKRLLKQIVLSSTYAQSPRISPANKTKDPQNLLLGRFPKLRLSAEAIRDNALCTGGLLTPALGGPPAYPPQPEGIWWIRDDKSPRYVTSTGEQRYRRSLYTIWRRTYLHPTLSNFDAPNRVTCSADRERTNTPLQALTLMNDPIFLEAGFGLARRMYDRSKSHSIKDAIRFGFCLSTTRNPDQTETDVLSGLYEKSLRNFSKDGDSAYKLLNSVRGELALGVSPLNASEVALLAAWFQVANVLLNLDETISKG